MSYLTASNVHKTYRLRGHDIPVLRGASVSVAKGQFVAIVGATGSGKSTLLHLLGGLDRPDRRDGGEITFDGARLGGMRGRSLDRYRAEAVGFVFQFYHLLPELTVLENVAIAAMVKKGRLGYSKAQTHARAEKILAEVGLSHRLSHRSGELSGGERQRVALARALINEPPLLLADEPTGNLDAKTGGGIMDQLLAHRAATKQTMVIVTHSAEVAARADRVVRLVDGRVVAE
ncbi:MAG TPA: ABC transporter ATP-binding protein [Phycisphaerales bacterium]|nr:ABC transporter ATP-binding protein [Phycisphaerales bacterium]